MGKKFKILSLLLALAMVLGLLAACSSSDNSSDAEEEETAVEEEAEPEEEEEEAAPAEEEEEPAEEEEEPAEPAAEGEPVYGGSLTMFFNNLNTDYDPAAPDFMNYMFWYEWLFNIDWGLTDDNFLVVNADNVTGQIADSWEWDEDAQTFTVTIRDDIYFQTLPDEYDYYGGRNLVATDVKWSYDRVLGTGSGHDEPVQSMMDWPSTLYMVDSIDTDGDYTVIFHFNTSSDAAVGDFMTSLVCIAGPEWDELSEDQRSDWHYACGTGPYIISDYVEGTNMTLTKNENYYAYDARYPENKLPYLDEIVLTKIDDNATLLAEFIAGDVDFIGNNWSVFSSSEAAQIEASMDESAYAEYHLDNTGRGIVLKQTSEALQDINVRKALQYAINLDEIATAYFDMDEWSLPTILNASTGYSSYDNWSDELKAEYLTYDPDLARQLLKEAGCYEDGSLTIQFCYVDSGDTDLYLLLRQYLADVGVTLELNPVETNAELVALEVGDNEACCYSEQGTTMVAMAMQRWISSGSEYSLGKEDTLDAMVEAYLNSGSMAEQKENAIAIDQYIMENHYVLAFTPTEQITYFTSGKIGGYNGEDPFIGWNAPVVMSHIWSTTGE